MAAFLSVSSKRMFRLFYVYECFAAWMYVYHMRTCCMQSLEEGVGFLGTVHIDGLSHQVDAGN